MPEKPIMHGRDHRPGGTDPIPGLGGLNWAHGTVDAISVAATVGNNQFPSSTSSPTAAKFFTNNSSVFQWAQSATFPGIYGIQVMTGGHYLVFAQFSVDSFGAGAVDLACFLADGPATFSSYFGVGELVTSTKVYLDEGGTDPTITVITFNQVNSGSSGVPAPPIVWNVNNSGANTAHLTGGSYALIQLDSDTTFI